MKQKTRFKNFGNIGIGLKKAILVDVYLQQHAVHCTLTCEIISYLNYTLCNHHQHDCTAAKAMDIIYILITV